jgi:hypothetical protein
MDIKDALEPTGKVVLVLDGEKVEYVKWFDDTLWWVDVRSGACDREVGHLDILEGDWEPYHEVEEIVPENAFELWKRGAYKYFTIRISGASLEFVNESGQSVTGIARAIHSKDGWIREYPKVKDENVERIEIEGVKWKRKEIHNEVYFYPDLVNSKSDMTYFQHTELTMKPPMKMILIIPAEEKK